MINSQQKTILLVEDEVLIAENEKSNLENFGYRVITAYTGEKAIDIFRNNDSIDLILMDVDLGKGIDGTESAKIIMNEREIPLVFLSNHIEPEIVEKTEKITSYGYVVKNSGETVLDASIKMAFKLFDKHRMLLESEDRYRSLFEKNNSIMLLIDPGSADIIDANESACKYYGWSNEEITKKKISEINTLPESLVIKEMKKAEMESSKYFNFKHVLANGDIRDVEVYSGPIIVSGKRLLYSIIYDVTDRKRAEEELSQSRERYRLLHEYAPIGIMLANKSGKILEVNSEVLKILGSPSVEAFKGINLLTLPLLIKAGISAAFKRCVETGQIVFGEYQYTTSWGKSIYIQLHFVPIFDDQNQVYLVHNIVEDITEQKLIEKELLISEEKFRGIFENSAQGIFQSTPEGRLMNVNTSLAEMLGYESVENILSSIHDIGTQIYAVPEDRDIIRELLNKNGSVRNFEVQCRNKNGGLLWILLNIRKVQDESGRILYLEGSGMNITERKQAEEALRASEEKYHNLYRYTNLGIFHSNFDDRFIDVNPALAKLLGYDSPEEAVKCITSISRQIYAKQSRRDEIGDTILKEGGQISVENHYRRKDGSLWYGMLNLRIVNDQQGKASYYEGFVEDITERKRAEEELRESEEVFQRLSGHHPMHL